MHALTLADEKRMLEDARAHEKIAPWSSERSRAALAEHPNLHARVDTGGNGNVHALLLATYAAAGACVAHPVRRLPARVACCAPRKARHRKVDVHAARGIGEANFDRDVDVLASPAGSQCIGLRAEPVV